MGCGCVLLMIFRCNLAVKLRFGFIHAPSAGAIPNHVTALSRALSEKLRGSLFSFMKRFMQRDRWMKWHLLVVPFYEESYGVGENLSVQGARPWGSSTTPFILSPSCIQIQICTSQLRSTRYEISLPFREGVL